MFRLILLSLTLLAGTLATSSFAGGGTESIVAELNGWTLTLNSDNGSSAYISRKDGDKELRARIEFQHFWDYLLVAETLPRTADNQKSPFRIVEVHRATRVVHLASESARPLFELMLLNHRTALSSPDAARVEAALNKNPPVDRRLLPNANFAFKVAAKD
jgi:hypothetical protein